MEDSRSMSCSIEDCKKPNYGKHLCNKHYQRFRRTGGIYLLRKKNTCKYKDCKDNCWSNEFCLKHYTYITRYENRLLKKLAVYSYLGGKCMNCDEDDKDVLNLDHINNDGYKLRKSDGSRIPVNYTKILKRIKSGEKIKDELQILCANCNLKKHQLLLESQRLEKLGAPNR